MRRHRWLATIALLLAGNLHGACTDVDIFVAAYAVHLSGRYCTTTSSLYDVPVRVLLVIDTSRSMEDNDPQGHRGRAAADLVAKLSAQGQNISFGLIEFNTAANSLTQGFTSDPATLNAALGGLNKREGLTNYLGALGLARSTIHDDLDRVAEEIRLLEETGEDPRRLRPWYFVVFLSDGIPRMEGGVLQSTESILRETTLLVDAPPEALGITLHTAFLGAKDDELRPRAEALLQEMAEVGHGQYFSFERGEEIDFTSFDFEVKRLYDIKQLLVFNRNAVLVGDKVLPDSDADGLADAEEELLGTDETVVDTDGDGFSDGFEVRTAQDPLAAGFACDADNRGDEEEDGLNDCEETFLNFDARRFDTDGDLFPDGLEFYSGSNPGDGGDVFEDLDFDGILTGNEIRDRTDPNRSDQIARERYAYKYFTARHLDSQSGSVCYDFVVENVSLGKTLETPLHGAGQNQIIVYFIESPEDDAENQFMLRRLVLQVPYSRKQRGEKLVEVGAAEFSLVATQDAEER